MCGIAGYVAHEHVSISTLERVADELMHRGPDETGVLHQQHGSSGLSSGLVHTRLRIIDLNPRSAQPMRANGISLVFNGEIYNYRELRAQLEQSGESFATESDTEVLLKGICRYGARFLERAEGMWAAAWLDDSTGDLSITRDRFGEKPLFVMELGAGVCFASEIRPLARLADRSLEPDFDVIGRFLVMGYKSLGSSSRLFVKGVRKLAPGTVEVFRGGALAERMTFWKATPSQPPELSKDEAVDRTKELLINSVEMRLRSDVPVALSLSGGVDSVGLASIATRELGRQLHTFHLVNEDSRYNELDNMRHAVSELGLTSHEIPINVRDPLERLKEIAGYRGAPILTLSSFIQNLLMEHVSRQGFRVIIGGNGADEIFTGYYDHYLFHIACLQGNAREVALRDWRTFVQPFVRNPLLSEPDIVLSAPGSRGHLFLNAERFSSYLRGPTQIDFHEEDYGQDWLRNRMLNEVYSETLPVLLSEEDANAMQFSVENRAPYLDSRLAAFVYSLPTEWLIQGGYSKWLLRAALEGTAPDRVVWSRRKIGFNAPIGDVMNLNSQGVRGFLLEESELWEVVDRNGVMHLLDQRNFTNSESKFLFGVLSSKAFIDSL